MKKSPQLPPVLYAQGYSIAQAWENAVLTLHDKGLVTTRKDKEDSGEQLDSVMTLEIVNPDADPISHRKGGTNAVLAPVLDYAMECMGSRNPAYNVRNHRNPTDTRWDYTYDERLTEYPNGDNPGVDQIAFAVKRLIENPSSRRTNIITWYPQRDTIRQDTPCLQSFWFNIADETLDMHYRMRSNNVMQASLGNILGFYTRGCDIRDKVEQATGQSLGMRIVGHIDSFHVNSHNYPTFKDIVTQIRKMEKEGDERFFTREEVIDGMMYDRDKTEAALWQPIEHNFDNPIHAKLGEEEKARIHAVGDRVFYLWDKYKPSN